MTIDTAGHTDWVSLVGNPHLRTLVDLPSGANDNAFGQGTKEDSTTVTVVTGSIPPNKNDLTRAYVSNDRIGGSKGDLLLAYDFGGSGTPTITLFTWDGSAWSNQQDLSALGFAEAAVNTADLSDVLNNNATVGAGEFGERRSTSPTPCSRPASTRTRASRSAPSWSRRAPPDRRPAPS